MSEPRGQPKPASLLATSAVVTVADVGASVAFYRDRLGFEVQWQDGEPPAYAIVFRDAASLHLNPASRNARARERLGKSSLYIWVDDAAALADEIALAGGAITVPLCATPYGTREFAVDDLDGNSLSFAQNVSSDA